MMVGEGNLGLIRAAEFDPDFGTRFSTYAAYWVKKRSGICCSTAPPRYDCRPTW